MMDDYIIELAEKERDGFLNGKRLQNSILPGRTPGEEVAETNSTQLLSWSDFLQLNIDDEEWLIEGILRPGWLGVLGGHGKQGKTTLTMHLLNAIRLGGKFISSCQSSPVIYVNCEMSPYDAKQLIKDVVGDTESDGEEAVIINQPPIPLKLEWVEKILSERKKPGVCVIDSFRGAFLLGGDTENQAGTVGVILRKLQNIARKTKWTIIIIHHFRKSGTGEALDLAGSGEWLSAPDVILTWDRPNFLQPGTLKLTGRIPPVEPFSINVTREKISVLGTVSFQEADSQRQRVLQMLTSEWATSEEVVSALSDIPAATVRRRLNDLYETSRIERYGKGVKGDSHKWRIKEEITSSLDNTNQKPCYACRSTRFWRRHDGGLVCNTCHPALNEESVKEWIVVEDYEA
jgi:hypothetical protein